jgi:RHS repeat-associated protein
VSAEPHVLLTMQDMLSGVSTVVDKATGERVESKGYRPYGDEEESYRSARWKWLREDYGFTGKEADTEVGLVYFGKRFLVPSLGRWLNPDPLALHAPGDADLNLYAYVRGKVFSSIDPWGLEDNAANTGTAIPSGGDACGSGGCGGEVKPDISASPGGGDGGAYAGSSQKASEAFAPAEKDAPKVFGATDAAKPALTARQRTEQSWLQAKAHAFNSMVDMVDSWMPGRSLVLGSPPKMAEPGWFATGFRAEQLKDDTAAVDGSIMAAGAAMSIVAPIMAETAVEMAGSALAARAAISESASSNVVTLDASAIRFSQSNVRNSLPQLTSSMKANGWQGAPIDVVKMADGSLTAIDNTRLAAAGLSNTRVQATIRGFGEAFPSTRAGGNLRGETWGEAVLNRIAGQKPAWQRLYPNGSSVTGVHPSTPGFQP